jgi:NifB/MoaA-like Fe-S oxidoreductase
LRWLAALLDAGVEVHGQIVVCPGVNDGDVLEDTLCGILDRFPGLATVAAVPLGISRYSSEQAMRPHTVAEAGAVIDTVERWQATFADVLGRRLVWAADEYYLLAGRDFPESSSYEGFPQHENGIGMARAFEQDLLACVDAPSAGIRRGFFAAVDGAPAEGYRAVRAPSESQTVVAVAAPGRSRRSRRARRVGETPVAILTGEYGARVLKPLLARTSPAAPVRVLPVANTFFGGNIAVTGLLVGQDIARVLRGEPADHRYLLPDVCLSGGRFLDGSTPADLPHPVEVVATDGASLRAALGLGAR